MPPLERATIPAAAAATGVLLAGALYVLGYRTLYHALLQYWGAFPFRFPFLDLHGVTAAIECDRLGFDVYVQNPCDVFQRVHAYSPVWLWLGVLPITTAWDNALGIAVVLLFLATLPFLPPGRGGWQTAIITLGTVSGVVAYALERANIDLLIFVLATIAAVLTRRGGRWATPGYAAAMLAAMLKFYPVALLILALRQRLAVFLAIGTVSFTVLAMWFVSDANAILRSAANIPTMDYRDDNVFAARDLPFGVAETLGLARPVAVLLFIALLVAMLGAAMALARYDDLRLRVRSLHEAEAVFLLVGCALRLVCFFAAQNGLYRAIHLLFVLPALTVLVQSDGKRGPHLWSLGLVGLVLILMWHEPIRVLAITVAARFGMSEPPAHFSAWLVLEIGWWIVVAALAGLMLRLVWEARAFRDAITLA